MGYRGKRRGEGGEGGGRNEGGIFGKEEGSKKKERKREIYWPITNKKTDNSNSNSFFYKLRASLKK